MGSLDERYLYIFEDERLKTFDGKRKIFAKFKNCTPSRFAEAGFVYAGSKNLPDNVKCFSCGKELNEWEVDDDPWEEHKKRGAECNFVQLKLKNETTVEDFLRLFYQVKKGIIVEYIEEKKKALEENQESLRKMMRLLSNKKNKT